LFSAIAVSLTVKSQKRFAAIFLKITALTLAITPIMDWLYVPQGIMAMLKLGNYQVVVVEVMLLSLALFCWLIASRLFVNQLAEQGNDVINTSVLSQEKKLLNS